jgi:hypothetical protein
MRIRYNLSRLDLFKARMVALMSCRPLIAVVLLIAALSIIGTFTQESLTGKPFGFKVVYLSLQTVFVIGGGLFFATLVNALRCLTAKAKGVIGTHTLEITDEGLVETTEYNTSLYRWSAFHKLKKSKRFLWIYVTDLAAYAVPLKRPLLEGDVTVFMEKISSKLENT